MLRSFYPIILLVAAGGLFWVLTDPTYQKAQSVNTEVASYNSALDKSKELQKLRDSLLAKYSTFATDDLNRLQLLLPDTVDNIQLVLDIDTVASQYGMVIRDLKINSAAASPTGNGFDPTSNEIKSVDLSFSVSADYNTFLKFIRDLQDSLRITDIESIDFTVADKPATAYNVTIRTYWLP